MDISMLLKFYGYGYGYAEFSRILSMKSPTSVICIMRDIMPIAAPRIDNGSAILQAELPTFVE
jgi:hypothetical protein